MHQSGIHPFGFVMDEPPVIGGLGRLRMAELPGLIAPCRVEGALSGPCRGITYDSRRVEPDMVFAALPGVQVDGRAYVAEALARGAAALLRPDASEPCWPAPTIYTSRPRWAMGRIAAAVNGHPSLRLRVVGVTGTNGKTSVAWLVRHLIERVGRRSGLIGTVRHDDGSRSEPAARTTPESPDLHQWLARMVDNGCDHAVMEVSSHALAQDRVAGIDFDVAVFTNLTPDHLDYHGTMEAYFEAKAKLFTVDGSDSSGVARVVNLDDPWGAKLVRRLHGDVLTFGFNPAAQVRAEDLRLDGDGARFRCVSPWGEADVDWPLIGRFNVYNALAAIAAAGALSLPWAELIDALATRPLVPGRLERVGAGTGPRVFVDYAHTEDALEQVLQTLRPLTSARLICVFGCGGDRDRAKRPRMGAVSSRWADLTVLTSDNPRSECPMRIIQEIGGGCRLGADVWSIPDRRQAIAAAIEAADPDDVIVVAGKGHETTQDVGADRRCFDDRSVVAELLRTRTEEQIDAAV